MRKKERSNGFVDCGSSRELVVSADSASRQNVTIIPIRAIRGARIPKTWLAFAAF
jgi:hypothetical protein